MAQKVRMHAKNIDDQYTQVYPETVASQVIVDDDTGETLEQMLQSGNFGSGGSGTVERKEFIVTATVDGQSEFAFNYPGLEDTDYVTVHLNGEFLHKGEEYTVTKTTGLPKVTILQEILVDDKIHILVERVSLSGGSGQLDSASSEKINNVLVAPVYYVDAVNGNDSNDGKTSATAWKSLAKASAALSNKVIVGGAGTLHLLPGTYDGILNLLYVDGGLLVKGYGSDATILKNPGSSNSETYNNILMTASDRVVVHDLKIDADTTNVPSGKAYYPILIDNVDAVVLNTGVLIDGVNYDGTKVIQGISYGIFVTNGSNVIMQGTMRDFNRAYYISHLGRVVSEDVRYDNCLHREMVNGGMFSLFTSVNTENIPTPITYSDKAGLDFNTMYNGTIIEEGVNDNGRYYAYGNGLVKLIKRIEVPILENNAPSTDIQWVLPYGIGAMSVLTTIQSGIKRFAPITFQGATGSQPTLLFHISSPDGVAPLRPTGQENSKIYIEVTAIGAWK